MVNIGAEKYTDAKVYAITVGNRELFWVRMCDVQVGLGVQNMSDLVRKEIHGICETKNPPKDQIRKYKRKEKELNKNCTKSKHVFLCSDLMARIIKSLEVKKKMRQNK